MLMKKLSFYSHCDDERNEESLIKEIDAWFKEILNKNESSAASINNITKSEEHDIEKLNKMNQKANFQYPQHDINELTNQLLLLDRLHALHEENKLNDLITYLCLNNEVSIRRSNEFPKLWLTSEKN